jgi:serine protease Do
MNNTIKTVSTLVVGVVIGIAGFAGIKLLNNSKLPIKIPIVNTKPTETKTVYQEKSGVIDVVKKVNPSVVSIAIKRTGTRAPFRPFDFYDSPNERIPSGQNEQGIGTGFIIASNGIIATNRHVVDTEGSYIVITNDNKKYDVTKITKDPRNDLALVKIDANNLPALELGDSSKLEVGQTVVAMGNQLGEFQNTVTAGIISGLNRQISASDQSGYAAEQLSNVIQTDAAINPGSSGGPLLNLGGQVIGINTAVAPAGVAQNIGFAIPINSAKSVVNEYIATGKISRPYIGVRYQMLTRRLALINDLPEGAFVEEVVSGGPAEKAGLKAEDIITEINGKKVAEASPLSDVIQNLKINETVDIKYYRGDKNETARITIGNSGE